MGEPNHEQNCDGWRLGQWSKYLLKGAHRWTQWLAVNDIDRPLHDVLNTSVRGCERNLQVSRDLFRLYANVSLANNGSGRLNGILATNVDCPSVPACRYDLRKRGIPVEALWVQMGNCALHIFLQVLRWLREEATLTQVLS